MLPAGASWMGAEGPHRASKLKMPFAKPTSRTRKVIFRQQDFAFTLQEKTAKQMSFKNEMSCYHLT